MAPNSTQTSSEPIPVNFLEFHQYPWSDDPDFLAGLEQIQSFANNDSQIVLKAKQFFYRKKLGIDIDLAEYQKWLEPAGESVEVTSESQTDSNLTYEQIVELIVAGKPIPGVKQIPDTILGTVASSNSKAAPRKKPWE
jgi:hypothetical protein